MRSLISSFSEVETLFFLPRHTFSLGHHFIELSFPTTTFDIFGERWTQLLTGTKVVKATHCFKHSIAMRTKVINTETVHFLLSACSVEALIFTAKSCTLKTRQHHSLKLRVLFCRGENLLVHALVTVWAVGYKLHCFCDDTWVWIFVTLPSCVSCWLHKTVEAFLWSVLNQTVFFGTTSSNCK